MTETANPDRSPATPFRIFAAEFTRLYQLETCRKTCYRVAQVLREVAGHGVCRVGDLDDPVLIAEWLKTMRKSDGGDRSGTTKRGLLKVLEIACKYAVGRGYLARSPFDAWNHRIATTKPRAKRHHPYADLARLIEDLRIDSVLGWKQHRLYAVIATLAMTGLRKAECLHLQARDIDLDNRTLTVSARFHLKTPESERTIGLPDALAAALGPWFREAKIGSNNGADSWLFPNCYGSGFWHEGKAKNRPLAAVKAAGLRSGISGLTILSFRHTFATLGPYQWDLSETVIAQILGHTSTVMTRRHYIHQDVPELVKVARIINFSHRA